MAQNKYLPRTTLPHITEWLKGLNCVLLECTRAFLHPSTLPKFLWGEAVKHAIWLKNRTVTRTLPNSKTPNKMLYSKKPNVAGLREWGTKVWVHDASGTKLDGRSRIGWWIGFKEVSNAHRILWPDNRSVTAEQNIKFDNNDLLNPMLCHPRGRKKKLTARALRTRPIPPQIQLNITHLSKKLLNCLPN